MSEQPEKPVLKYQALMEELSCTTFVKEHGKLLTGDDILLKILDSSWDHKFIIDVFTWRRTPEGVIYWKSVYERETLTDDARRRLRQMLDEFVTYHGRN